MKKEPKTHPNTLYAIHYKGQLLGSFKWGDGAPNLYGWRPPKKVYWKLGLAKSGATHLPEDILDDCEIVEYAPVKTLEKLSTKDRQKKRLERELKDAQNDLKWNHEWHAKAQKENRDAYQRNIKKAEEKIEQLKAKLINNDYFRPNSSNNP